MGCEDYHALKRDIINEHTHTIHLFIYLFIYFYVRCVASAQRLLHHWHTPPL